MNKKIKEALEGSIDKWQKIVDYLETRQRFTRSIYGVMGELEQKGRNCPLCILIQRTDCNGCPVQISTGRRGCNETPYYAFTAAVDNQNLAAMKVQAKAELDFLISLRE